MTENNPEPGLGRPPTVAIVGRPNVGKSSLLNLLAQRRIAIVHPTSGVTRDRVSAFIEHDAAGFEAWDTGGMGMVDKQELEEEVEAQIDLALERADLVLFVVDAQRGFDEADHAIARRLRLIRKPVLLVANKVDHSRHENLLPELHRLGLGEPVPVSALHGTGRTDLLDQIIGLLPRKWRPAERKELILAVVGRQNVGKSTLVNRLAQEERMIVSETAGTTRDSVDVRFHWEGRDYTIIDTAGLKRRIKIRGDLEFYSAHRAERSIRRADVALLMLDASREIGRTDKKIASYIETEGKPCLILINKWDLAKNITPEEFTRYLSDHLRVVSYAPILYMSALEGKNISEVLSIARSLHEQAGVRIGTGELNRILQAAVKANAPSVKGSAHPRVFYGTQVDAHPPTFALFVSHREAFDETYRRYLAGFLRHHFPFKEVPLTIHFREREREKREFARPRKTRTHREDRQGRKKRRVRK
jgi:GTP-binding protein